MPLVTDLSSLLLLSCTVDSCLLAKTSITEVFYLIDCNSHFARYR